MKRKTDPRLKAALHRILRAIPRLKAAVIGDLLVDEYVVGRTARVSREAPVLILRYQESRSALGGAANTANNVASLGARVWPLGTVGEDAAGRGLTAQLRHAGMDTSSVIASADTPTITKTRILAGGLHTAVQQVIRIDREPEQDPPAAVERRILREVDRLVRKMDVLILSDYGYGVLGEAVVARLNQHAREKGPAMFVDAQKDLLRFRGMQAITPNEPEVEDALKVKLSTDDETILAGRTLLERSGHACVVITRGRKGMAVIERGAEPVLLDIYGTDEVADVTGAGDTVVATLALARAAGAGWHEAAVLANMAAGIVVTKSGTVPITRAELSKAVSSL